MPICRRGALRALAALGAWAGGGWAQAAAQAEPSADGDAFEFVALGDMPYGPDAMAGPSYRHLIGMINDAAPAFSIHVGDFKDGLASCDDDEYQRQWSNFQRFAGALVYTPGDNDWFDCHRRGDDPLERLQALRERFFARAQSLGQRPIALQRQSEQMPAFARYRENQRWLHRGVVFATFHTVGAYNGYDGPAPAVRAEAGAREAANAAWIREAFALAHRQRARALVLATQAEAMVYPYLDQRDRGVVRRPFASIGSVLLPLAEAAPIPVLLVHGDFHRYRTDQPFYNRRGQPIANLWRLEVFGEPRMHAVRVRVQPQVRERPFAFTPIWNPMSTDPRLVPGPNS
ncbi:MAG: hypothetical protein JNL87_09385 [Burkholderiaceae bacterium]|nr:hypothetical protein [Burkholderiaceae bacterium]